MEELGSNETNLLWKKYKKENDLRAREKLILHYIPLVKYVAGQLIIGLRGYFELDDLISAGVYGLICAVDRFDPDKGFKFETFALARIKGAIFDWLRSMNWMPHSIRNKARELEKALMELEQSLGRPPDDHELADYLGLTVEKLQKLLHEVTPVTLVSLEECLFSEEGKNNSVSLAETVADPRAEDPLKCAELGEIKQVLAKAIARLPEKERLVVTLYYYEDLTLKEIGKVIGVSESRVCQLHTKAILRLRGYLSKKKEMLTT